MSDSIKRPMRILIVENHADTLHWLTLYLEESGHTVFNAKTVAEARTTLARGVCDVLISDIGLPDGTGWELLEDVTLPRPIFAIAMSGFGMNADNARSLKAGYRHHLLKPFKVSELDEMLKEAEKSVMS
jgi:DNA-binding response OmpR family regulator